MTRIPGTLVELRVAETLFKCGEITRREPTNKPKVARFVEELRPIEHKLGIDRSPRAGTN